MIVYSFSIAACRREDVFEIFYMPGNGWASDRLDYREGVGPYFSLPEALRRAEQIVGDAVWKPFRVTR